MRARAIGFLLGVVVSAAAFAQSGIQVELDEVVDNRVTAGAWSGSLDLRVKLKGSALDKASAARIVVKDARDDRGTVLSEGSRMADFMPRDYNSGTLQVSLATPARAAGSVRVKGTVELFVPSRDPNATVKIDKALAKLDAPLSSKALKAAKVTITPMSRTGYAAAQKARKLDATKIEAIRAEAKKQGVPEAEIQMALELAKAMESMDDDVPENAVILSGTKADFDRIFRVEILGADGKPLETSGRSTSTRGDSSVMTLMPSTPPPPNASLQIFLLTDKSRVSSPFDLNVTLP
jgi:Tfp pilus assembly protein PilN